MARAITEDFTFDEMENETLFSRAALRADPNASDFVLTTNPWLGFVASARAQDLAARTALQESTASRVIANQRLDETCRNVGRALSAELKNDRSSARWARIFGGTVDEFIHKPLAVQATACKSWLETDEPVLAPFRADIALWANAAEAAIRATSDSGQVRGTALVGRESVAETLTRARDGLHAALVARANERNLPRDFADGFFILTPKKANKGPKA